MELPVGDSGLEASTGAGLRKYGSVETGLAGAEIGDDSGRMFVRGGAGGRGAEHSHGAGGQIERTFTDRPPYQGRFVHRLVRYRETRFRFGGKPESTGGAGNGRQKPAPRDAGCQPG